MKKSFFVIVLLFFLLGCRPSVEASSTTIAQPEFEFTATSTFVVPTKVVVTPTKYVTPEFLERVEWAQKGVLEDFLTSSEVNPEDIAFMDDQKYYADFSVVMGDQRYNFVRFNTWVTGEKVLYAEVKSGKGDYSTWVKLVREVGEMDYGSELLPSVRWMHGKNVVLEYPADFVCEGEAYACYVFYPPYYTPDIGFGKVGGYSIYSENIESVIKKVLN